MGYPSVTVPLSCGTGGTQGSLSVPVDSLALVSCLSFPLLWEGSLCPLTGAWGAL